MIFYSLLNIGSGWQTLAGKDHIVHILGFKHHMFSATTTEPCHYSWKAAIDNTEMTDCSYILIKLHLQKTADYKR